MGRTEIVTLLTKIDNLCYFDKLELYPMKEGTLMNVSLTPALEKLIQTKVKTGLYNSASEVIREALRLLDEQDRLRRIRLEDLKREIAVGIDQADRGELVDGKEVFQKLRARNKSSWKK